MEAIQQIKHVPTGLSHILPLKTCWKWNQEMIQTCCCLAVFLTTHILLVTISSEQKLNQPSGCSNLSCESESQTLNHLLDLGFLCLHHSWAAREGYLPNQLFLAHPLAREEPLRFYLVFPKLSQDQTCVSCSETLQFQNCKDVENNASFHRKYTSSQSYPKATV